MKVFLLQRDRDFDFDQPLPANAQALRQDLELDVPLGAMAAGDDFLLDVATKVLLSTLTEPEAITYRQDVLEDCVGRPAVVAQLYDLAIEGIEAQRRTFLGYHGATPDTILSGSVRVLEGLVDALKTLRKITDEHAGEFRSEGFLRFFEMVASELDDDYLSSLDEHLRRLRFPRGALISARLGRGNVGIDYTLRAPNPDGRSWLRRITPGRDHTSYTFQIAERDQAGATAVSDLRTKGINVVANAAAQSADHIVSFFKILRSELGFYLACLNLRRRLVDAGDPVCIPTPAPPDQAALRAAGLYDASLRLTMRGDVVGNDLAADGKRLIVITGANSGGKSTLMRALGIAQLMLQCGMFVAAESFRAGVSTGLFTHYKREEDAAMKRGKLDDELARMSEIADHIRPDGMLLCNESFASTNEREGSEIARQVVHALLETSIRVVFVTHMFDLADGLHRESRADSLFLRAERRPNGQRTFKLTEGAPLPTSYGKDVYEQIFSASTPPTGPAR